LLGCWQGGTSPVLSSPDSGVTPSSKLQTQLNTLESANQGIQGHLKIVDSCYGVARIVWVTDALLNARVI